MSKFLNFFQKDTKQSFLLNILAVGTVSAILVLLFFFVYLPVSTNHAETYSVPDVVGKSEAELAEIFDGEPLRYEVSHGRYNATLPASVVISQNPKANVAAKRNRKVYITVNGEPKMVKLPTGLIDKSLLNAQTQLRSARLKVGETIKIPAQHKNRVFYLQIKGKRYTKIDIKRGIELKEGDKVDIVVGDGKRAASNTDEDIISDEDVIEDASNQ